MQKHLLHSLQWLIVHYKSNSYGGSCYCTVFMEWLWVWPMTEELRQWLRCSDRGEKEKPLWTSSYPVNPNRGSTQSTKCAFYIPWTAVEYTLGSLFLLCSNVLADPVHAVLKEGSTLCENQSLMGRSKTNAQVNKRRLTPHLNSLSCKRRAGLNLPHAVPNSVQLQALCNLRGWSSSQQVLLISKDQNRDATKFLLLQQLAHLLHITWTNQNSSFKYF